MIMRGYSKFGQPSSSDRRASVVKIVVATCSVIAGLFLVAPARVDFNQYVLGQNTIPGITPQNKPVDLTKILMTASEVKFVLKYVSNNINTYLEWGSGGSTLHFPQYIKKRFVSIEHDKTWCEKMKNDVEGKNTVPVEVHCVAVERGTGGWGKKSPFEEGSYKIFREYIDEIDHIGEKNWDMILIDGRARVDASIKALSYLRNDSIVVLHDTWRMVKSYRDIHKYYDVVEESYTVWNQGIGVLKRKKEFAYLEGRNDLVQNILNTKYGLKR